MPEELQARLIDFVPHKSSKKSFIWNFLHLYWTPSQILYGSIPTLQGHLLPPALSCVWPSAADKMSILFSRMCIIVCVCADWTCDTNTQHRTVRDVPVNGDI